MPNIPQVQCSTTHHSGHESVSLFR